MKPALNDLKILLVEDQTEARALLRNMLLELGITQIFEASNGEEALNFLDSAYDFIDMVMCDWNMPSVSGLDVLRDVRKVNESLPFLMVTGRSDVESVKEAKEAGVTAYIRKPFTPKQLEAKLRIMLYKMAV